MKSRFIKIFIFLWSTQLSFASQPFPRDEPAEESHHFVTLKAASAGWATLHLSLDALKYLGVPISELLRSSPQVNLGDTLHWVALGASIHAGLYTLGFTCFYPNNDPHWYVKKFLTTLMIHGIADYYYYNAEELSDQDHLDFKAVLILSSFMTLYYGMRLNQSQLEKVRKELEKIFKFKKT
jgi:hypothetical protein